MFESYSQNGEDIVLWRALGAFAEGTYVDVGAADPDHDSVTKAFYERGWNGLNIEPAPDYAQRLVEARPRDTLVQACAGNEEGTIVLHHVLETGLSSVLASAIKALEDTDYSVTDIEVPVKRLDSILAESGLTPEDPIHFLKIDVEGFEESVIRSIDLDIWRPWVIVAESTRPRSTEQAHHEWEPLLLHHGYEFCLFDGLNRYYLASEHPELRHALSFPPCVFDQPFLTPPHAQLMREYEKLMEGHARLVVLHDEALAAYDERGAEIERVVGAADDLDEEYHRVLEAWNRLDEAWKVLDKSHAQLLAEHEQVTNERSALRDGVSRMGTELDQLRQQRDDARRESDDSRNELTLTRQTLSWRVTRPLRSVRRLRGG